MTTRLSRLLGLLALSALAAGVAAAPAPAMRSKVIAKHLCRTVGGGRFVDIPWFPGEKIDRRLLLDIKWMRRHYDIFVTDGYSTDPVHARRGEHPIGLATDIVPDRSRDGTWRLIGALAHWAEPRQDEPRLPFRWVGWNGDPGHGRGDHLHLSWAHSETEPTVPARVVYTRICPTTTSTNPWHFYSGGTSAGGGGDSGGTASPGKMALAPIVPEGG